MHEHNRSFRICSFQFPVFAAGLFVDETVCSGCLKCASTAPGTFEVDPNTRTSGVKVFVETVKRISGTSWNFFCFSNSFSLRNTCLLLWYEVVRISCDHLSSFSRRPHVYMQGGNDATDLDIAVLLAVEECT